MSDARHDATVSKAVAMSGEEHVPTFSADEEHFLRAYADSKSRLEALMGSGQLGSKASMREQEAALDWASGVLAKAERLRVRDVACAVGADIVFCMARLKECCDMTSRPDIVLKALVLLLRVYGINDKTIVNRQVALVFDESKSKNAAEPPEGLPFTLQSGDYSLFTTDTDQTRQ